MGTKFEVESKFATTTASVVEAVLDNDVQKNLYADLKYSAWTEEKRDEGGGKIKRTLRVVPPVTVPAFVKKALGDSTGYREEQDWNEARTSYRWSVSFDMSSRLTLIGDCIFTDDGKGGCTRKLVCEAKASIPLLGGKLEKYIRDETTRTDTEMTAALAKRLA